MFNRLRYEERRWFNWLEFAMFVEKNRWQVIKLPEPAGRLVSVQNIDNFPTYNESVFKRKAGVNESVYACDVSVPEKLSKRFLVEHRLPTAIESIRWEWVILNFAFSQVFLRFFRGKRCNPGDTLHPF